MRQVEVNAVRDDERVGLGAAGGVGPNDIVRESSPFGPEPGDSCEDMVAYFDHLFLGGSRQRPILKKYFQGSAG